MSKKVVMGLDLDGVLYDFHDALYIHSQYTEDYQGTFTEFWRDYFPSLSVKRQDYLVSLDILYDVKIPTVEISDFLEFSGKNSDALYYITARDMRLERVTKRYLRRYGFPSQENIIFTNDKATACRLYGVTHFLDDFTHHVESVSSVAKAYLMAKLWNKNKQNILPTVHTLEEFRKEVF